jgi:hypothetical protein
LLLRTATAQCASCHLLLLLPCAGLPWHFSLLQGLFKLLIYVPVIHNLLFYVLLEHTRATNHLLIPLTFLPYAAHITLGSTQEATHALARPHPSTASSSSRPSQISFSKPSCRACSHTTNTQAAGFGWHAAPPAPPATAAAAALLLRVGPAGEVLCTALGCGQHADACWAPVCDGEHLLSLR